MVAGIMLGCVLLYGKVSLFGFHRCRCAMYEYFTRYSRWMPEGGLEVGGTACSMPEHQSHGTRCRSAGCRRSPSARGEITARCRPGYCHVRRTGKRYHGAVPQGAACSRKLRPGKAVSRCSALEALLRFNTAGAARLHGVRRAASTSLLSAPARAVKPKRITVKKECRSEHCDGYRVRRLAIRPKH